MFLRIFLWSLIIFFLIRFLWRILAPMLRSKDRGGSVESPGRNAERKRMDYKDVQDAKFHDLPKEEGREGNDRKTDS